MTIPLVSIVTPTFARGAFLRNLLLCVKAQTYPRVEWLILDDSPEEDAFFRALNDPSIRYRWSDRRLPVGDKRNALIASSSGDIIAQFDDDDYYAPNYVAGRVEQLDAVKADMSLLNGFFVCHLERGLFGYYQTERKQGPAFRFSKRGVEGVLLDNENIPLIHLCYGFSHVFRRAVWAANPFDSLDVYEDRTFVMRAMEAFKVYSGPDEALAVLHTAHARSSSVCFPQFRIPRFVVDAMNSDALGHIDRLAQTPIE